MKLTKSDLRRLIREERARLTEAPSANAQLWNLKPKGARSQTFGISYGATEEEAVERYYHGSWSKGHPGSSLDDFKKVVKVSALDWSVQKWFDWRVKLPLSGLSWQLQMAKDLGVITSIDELIKEIEEE